MRRIAATTVATFIVAGMFAVPALAGTSPSPYPPSPSPSPSPSVAGRVTVSDRTIDCGADSLRVSGSGWTPGQTVQISFAGEQVGSASPDAQGSFSVQVVPPDAPSGEHTLRATQGANQATARVTCVGDGAVGGLVATGVYTALRLPAIDLSAWSRSWG